MDKVKIDGDRILVYADRGCDVSLSKKEVGSSGGTSIGEVPGKVSSDLRITPEDVFSCTRGIETEVWRKTGAVHCSVLFSEGKCVVKSSDVGRHNTVDKVVGYAILNGIDLSRWCDWLHGKTTCRDGKKRCKRRNTGSNLTRCIDR